MYCFKNTLIANVEVNNNPIILVWVIETLETLNSITIINKEFYI